MKVSKHDINHISCRFIRTLKLNVYIIECVGKISVLIAFKIIYVSGLSSILGQLNIRDWDISYSMFNTQLRQSQLHSFIENSLITYLNLLGNK